MRNSYELRDVESSDLIGVYRDQRSALAVIRAEVSARGGDRLQMVALGRLDRQGAPTPIAMGADLIALATRRSARGETLRGTATRSPLRGKAALRRRPAKRDQQETAA